MQKTIKQWLEELPEPYRSKALTNLENCALVPVSDTTKSLSDAICNGFGWASSPEGSDFWCSVSQGNYPDAEEPRTLVVLDQDKLPEPPIPQLKPTVPVDDDFVLDWPKPGPVSDFPNDGPSETYATDGTVVFEKQHQEPFLQVEGRLMTEGVLKHLSEGLNQHEAIEADTLDRVWDDVRARIHAPVPRKTNPKPDPVNHPSHYTKGDVECIDALAAATIDLTGMEAVCTANAIKYLWRWKHKNGVEDLKKAKFYIDKLITDLER